jgi:phenolic acid decarboxylase
MNPRESTPTILRYMEFEPRWHGWAMWKLWIEEQHPEKGVAYVHHIQKGWKRRPKGSRYAEYVIGSVPS